MNVQKQTKRRLSFLVIAAGVLGGFGLAAGRIAEVRPAELTSVSSQAEAEGRSLLLAAAKAHGIDSFVRHSKLTVEGEDRWPGLMGSWIRPFPTERQGLVLDTGVHGWKTELTLQGGPRDGERWLVTEDRKVSFGPKGQTLEPTTGSAFSSLLPADFTLRAYRYFILLPFEIHGAEIVASLGAREVEGSRYDVVFATWKSLLPNAESDQYLLYLDPQSHRLCRVEYTVRETAGSALGVAIYSGLVEVDGVSLPAQVSIRAIFPLGIEREIHVLALERGAFERIPG